MNASGRYPRSSAELTDLKKAARDFVLPGFIPEKPSFTPSDIVMTQGSCFADNLHAALLARGQHCRNLSLNEFVNSPALNAAIFSYICEKKPFVRPDHAETFAAFDFAAARLDMAKVRLMILTLGVASYRAAGKVPVTAPEGGEWFTPTVPDLVEDLRSIVRSIRTLNATCEILFTVSPVPLSRSPWHPSPVVADVVSKSSLRMAAQILLDEGLVRYWPSFEIVRWLGAHIPGAYGADDGSHRHVSRRFIDVIIELFLESYRSGDSA